jgi:hypothetical protein
MIGHREAELPKIAKRSTIETKEGVNELSVFPSSMRRGGRDI